MSRELVMIPVAVIVANIHCITEAISSTTKMMENVESTPMRAFDQNDEEEHSTAAHHWPNYKINNFQRMALQQ